MSDHDIVFMVAFTTLIILLLIAGVVITIFVANKQRLQQNMKLAQMQLDYQKELRVVENEVQEQVLTNISRELHDNIGQLLTVMRFQLEQKKLDAPEMEQILKPMDETLTDTMQQVRLLGRSLNSDLLEQNGLLHTINQEVNRLLQFNHLKIHWKNDDTEPVLNKDQRLMSFRIFQEILNNMLKHANAKNISIVLQGKEDFKMVVEDDGKGFDVSQTMQTGSGSGLRNIVKRAALANLDCQISAAIGKGSIFTLQQVASQ
ncbi:MAG TPA: ATP-binding protein [Flavipsychrobacter sp.]|nr:ATP-binding protein [Flavipsychrobacter sp.]